MEGEKNKGLYGSTYLFTQQNICFYRGEQNGPIYCCFLSCNPDKEPVHLIISVLYNLLNVAFIKITNKTNMYAILTNPQCLMNTVLCDRAN